MEIKTDRYISNIIDFSFASPRKSHKPYAYLRVTKGNGNIAGRVHAVSKCAAVELTKNTFRMTTRKRYTGPMA